MLKRTGRIAATALAMAVALSGCTSPSPPSLQKSFVRAVVSEGDVRLGNAVMAFFVGPQNNEMFTTAGQVHKPGYLILVNADGSFRTIKTKRMDMLRPAWSDHGLYLADESSDYHLAVSGLTKAASPKSNAQNLMFALRNGGSVGVFNSGQENEGYSNQIGVTTDGKARLYDVQGNYFTGARCDDQIFGLTNMPGTHRSVAPKRSGMTPPEDPEQTPQMLARLYPADGGEKVVAWRPSFGTGTPIGPVPCHNGIITFLSWDADPGGLNQQPKVVSWDTKSGGYRAHPLTFDDATKLDYEDFGYVVQDWRDGQLHWAYADGRVFSTVSATGKTVTLFNTTLKTGPKHATRTVYAFSANQFHALTTTPGGQGDITYTTFDRASRKRTRTVSIPIPNAEINVSYLGLTHMAVRPQS